MIACTLAVASLASMPLICCAAANSLCADFTLAAETVPLCLIGLIIPCFDVTLKDGPKSMGFSFKSAPLFLPKRLIGFDKFMPKSIFATFESISLPKPFTIMNFHLIWIFLKLF